jgi:uncharacterized membrane protein YkoI
MNLLKPILLATLLATAGVASANVSRDGAAAVAQRATGGRVLAVESATADGRPAWRVKVVTPNGDVRVILIDAASGRPL